MLGDPPHEISSTFWIRRPTGLADRGTFIVDQQGVIQAIEITAEGIGRDALELLRKVKAAQYVAAHPGEVCPAKWKEGEKTLKPSLDLVGKIYAAPRPDIPRSHPRASGGGDGPRSEECRVGKEWVRTCKSR